MPPKKLRNVPHLVCGYCTRQGVCPHCEGSGTSTFYDHISQEECTDICEHCNGTGKCPMCGESAIISKPTPKGGE